MLVADLLAIDRIESALAWVKLLSRMRCADERHARSGLTRLEEKTGQVFFKNSSWILNSFVTSMPGGLRTEK